jgi:phosphonate transport system substrate-binding protein
MSKKAIYISKTKISMINLTFNKPATILLFVLSVSASSVWSACLGDREVTQVVTIAVVPQLQRSVTYTNWAPLLERLGQRTKLSFDLVIPETIPAFEKLLLTGQPDLAFVNPYHAVVAKKRQGYVPLLMDGSAKLSGILTVKADSPIRDIRELQGKEIAFPSPNAFAASLLIRAELANKGIQIYPRYAMTHANSYRAVALGEVVAAGGVNNTWQREDPALRARLRVLYETSGHAPHPLIAHPRMTPAIRQSVVTTMMSFTTSEVEQKLLDGIYISQPIHVNFQRDFAPLGKLKLEKFAVFDEN